MRTAAKVGAFGGGLALVFGAAFGVGGAVGQVTSEPERHDAHDAPGDGDGDGEGSGGHGADHDTDAAGAGSGEGGEGGGAEPAVGGLRIAERGYTLVPHERTVPAGRETAFRFEITGPDGEPVTRYEESHEKDLHLIVAGRDLSGFQHLHPTLGEDGVWSVSLTLAEAGSYRVFADFTPAGDPAGALTLGADVAVAGEYTPRPLPEPDRTATVDGYTVTLDGDLAAGAETALTLSVSRDGRPVTDLQPYLGAYGHLVALREGDLAYLHVHPQGEPGDGRTSPGPDVTFHTEAPSEGAYRLYLDFRHGGEVRTAEFTVTVGSADQTGGAGGTGGTGGGHTH
ncbi:hypothetical protein ACTWP5_15195 [Streptomyces sp. 4N509B]|uniref:hypothetical protein n=1 Tax=Streptomyces sp. 4N509B TaxID=3457413 RepID=UPI003FD2E6F7